MTFRPTPNNIEAAYDFLRTCKPYLRLKLPEPDDLEFRVTRHKDRFAHFRPKSGGGNKEFHEIAVSEIHVRSAVILLITVGHEMLHLYQEQAHTATSVQHNAEFKRLAKVACSANGFDLASF